MITYPAGPYEHCPRGAGDIEAHRVQHLVHLVIDGRLHCVFHEVYDHLEKMRLAELHALDERCKGA